jgi:molecular chaperone DnaK (HSP70)
MFYTMVEGQTELKVTVTQGEDTSIEYVNQIATHTLKLPPGRPAECPIKVTYGYDVNQRMQCRFEDVESGKVLEVDLSLDKEGKVLEKDLKEQANELNALKVE